MDSSLQQLITSAVASAVTTAVASIQAKRESEMLSLWEMIEKSLLLRESPPLTPAPDPDAAPKSLPAGDSLPKASTERWNQADLGYFDPHLDMAHGEGEIVSVGKDVYYRNVVLFIQRFQNLVTFRGAALVKANIATSLRGSALEWYTSELSDFDRDALNNDPGVTIWVNTLSHRFKVPTSVALGLLTDETYTFDDARARRPPAQYVRAIMQHGIGCNIVDVANQLSFAYRGLAPELWVFVSPSTESTKAADFICALEEKQEVWHEMMTTPAGPQQYYNLARKSSPYRPPLPSQSKAFSRYQALYRGPISQQAWRPSEQGSDRKPPPPPPQRHYTQQPFCQIFMPQRQAYPYSQRQMSSPAAPYRKASRTPQASLSASINSEAHGNPANRDAPRHPNAASQPAPRQPYQSNAAHQPVPHQPYQSNPPDRGYQRSNEKEIYQIEDKDTEQHPEGFYTTFEQEGEEVQYSDKGFDEVNANFVGIKSSCGKCGAPFSSRSLLHKHLKDGCVGPLQPSLPGTPASTSPIPIITSKSVVPAMGSGLAFRGWTYATAAVTLVPQVLPLETDPSATACLNIGCGVTLVDKNWLLRQLSHQKIKEMSTPLKVRGIGTSKHESAQFAEVSLFLPGESNEGQKVYASIRCELHLVEGLRANILIGNDMLAPESFVLNISLGHALVGSCGVKIIIRARQRGQFLKRKLLAEKDELILPRSETMIPLLPVPLPDDRDFLFHPTVQPSLTLFAHIMHHDTKKILVKNTFDRPLRISRRQKMGHVVDIWYDNCFLADAESAFHSTTVPPQTAPFFEHKLSITPTPPDLSMETTLENEVRVYGDKHAVTLLAQLVAEYPSIWESEGFVQIPPERWMKVPLKPGWEEKVSAIKFRVYPLGNEACQIVDETFDEMHRLGRLKFTSEHTPFNFPVFVVYKLDAEGKRKGRAVVDIRKLNDMVLLDSYPLPL